jgi:hypothetical protein
VVEKLFRITTKRIPSIYDSNTIYKNSEVCTKCGENRTKIDVLGAFLPSFKHAFGLIKCLGGITGSKKAIDYLLENEINGFTTEKAIVTFGNRNAEDEEYFWLKPLFDIELNSDMGPGPAIVCENCHRRMWKKYDGINIVKNSFSSDLYLIKYSWVILCSERFMKIANNAPDKCFLNFDQWDYKLE